MEHVLMIFKRGEGGGVVGGILRSRSSGISDCAPLDPWLIVGTSVGRSVAKRLRVSDSQWQGAKYSGKFCVFIESLSPSTSRPLRSRYGGG